MDEELSLRDDSGFAHDWFEGIRLEPPTKKSFFDVPSGPAHIVLYQKNIKAVCSSEAEVRQQIRQNADARTGALFRHDRGTTQGRLGLS